jgi:hypothetical protein
MSLDKSRIYTCGELSGTDCGCSKTEYFEPETEPVTISFPLLPGRSVTVLPDKDPEPAAWYWYSEKKYQKKHPGSGEWEYPSFCPVCGAQLLILDDGEPEAIART